VNRILDINVSVTTSVTTVYFHYQELSGDGKINVFSSKINPNYCLVWCGTPKDRTVRNFVLQITYQSHDICPIKFFKIIMQISLYFENITLSPAIFQTPGQNYLCVRTKL